MHLQTPAQKLFSPSTRANNLTDCETAVKKRYLAYLRKSDKRVTYYYIHFTRLGIPRNNLRGTFTRPKMNHCETQMVNSEGVKGQSRILQVRIQLRETSYQKHQTMNPGFNSGIRWVNVSTANSPSSTDMIRSLKRLSDYCRG